MTYQILNFDTVLAQGSTPGECVLAVCQRPNAPQTLTTVATGKTVNVYVANRFWARKEPLLLQAFSDEYSFAGRMNYIADKFCRLHGYQLQRVVD